MDSLLDCLAHQLCCEFVVKASSCFLFFLFFKVEVSDLHWR